MGILNKLLGGNKPDARKMLEHPVIVHFQYGKTDLQPIFELEDELERAITKAGVGEFDDNDIATDGSDGYLYMYGPDADRLFTTVCHVLESSDFIQGATVKLRYGPPEDGVAEPGEKGQAFRSVSLSDFPRFRENSVAYSFLMSKPSGRIDVNDYTHLSYRVLDDQGSAQEIEVEDENDDRTVWSRYRATHADIMPLSSRMFYFGYMFSAIPYAIGAALALYGTGRLLRRRCGVCQ